MATSAATAISSSDHEHPTGGNGSIVVSSRIMASENHPPSAATMGEPDSFDRSPSKRLTEEIANSGLECTTDAQEYDVELGVSISSPAFLLPSSKVDENNKAGASTAATNGTPGHHEEREDSVRSLPQLEGRNTMSQRPSLRQYRSERQTERKLINYNQQVSLTLDLESGKKKGARAQCAVIRDPDESHAQCRRRRKIQNAKRKATEIWGALDGSRHDRQIQGLNSDSQISTTPSDDRVERSRRRKRSELRAMGAHVPIDDNTQYRLVSIDVTESDKEGHFLFRPGFYKEITDDEKGCRCFGFQPNDMVISYLFWAFRSSFMAVLVSAAVWFYFLTSLFALAFYGLGQRKPQCINLGGKEFSGSFMDAYALSWTTFSTVGFGLASPATSATAKGDIIGCTGITILTTLESFVGILVASFWGAIFLSKVSRVSSFAQVVFSDPILIRYGKGIGGTLHGTELADLSEGSSDDNGDEDSKKSENDEDCKVVQSTTPCPILEFRVLNKLERQKQGEIIDASMNIVASVEERQIQSSARDRKSRNRRRGKKRTSRRVNSAILSKKVWDTELPGIDEYEKGRNMAETMVLQNAKGLPHVSGEDPMDQDCIGSPGIKKVFAKIEIESQEHPFFRRIWMARHVLGQNSPLLKPEAQELIRLNGGHWPLELSNPEGVRASVNFDQILVSLSGTSSADCNSVYAQKVYEYVDLCIGYKFSNMLFRDDKGDLCADQDLLNDVVEQEGGGGEDLKDRVCHSLTDDIFIL